MKITTLEQASPPASPFNVQWSVDGDPDLVKEYSITIYDSTGTPVIDSTLIPDPNVDLEVLKDAPRDMYMLEIIPFGIDDKEGGKIRAQVSVNDTGLESLQIIQTSPSPSTLMRKGSPTAVPAPPGPTTVPQPMNVVTITAIDTLSNINVTYGTVLASVGLPASVVIHLSDGTAPTAPIVWDTAGAAYNANTAGSYAFIGMLSLPVGITNPRGFAAIARVTVAPAPMTVMSVEPIGDITVSHGTALTTLAFPPKALVVLSTGNVNSMPVTWDVNHPTYVGTSAGGWIYTFTGILTLPTSVTNPGNVMATIRVNMSPAPVSSQRNFWAWCQQLVISTSWTQRIAGIVCLILIVLGGLVGTIYWKHIVSPDVDTAQKANIIPPGYFEAGLAPLPIPTEIIEVPNERDQDSTLATPQ